MACKLIYFDLNAIGEPIRMLLAYQKISFEDIRYDRNGNEWLEKKSSYPMGQLPVLEIDGISLHQSKAICRYLAKKTDLYGENDVEAAQIDMVVDVIYDFIMKMRVPRDISDPVAKEAKYEEFKNKAIPFYLSNLDNMAKLNNGYLGCSKLSWADIYFTGAIDYLEKLGRVKFRNDYLNLKKVMENVNNEPKLKNYLANRPTNVKF